MSAPERERKKEKITQKRKEEEEKREEGEGGEEKERKREREKERGLSTNQATRRQLCPHLSQATDKQSKKQIVVKGKERVMVDLLQPRRYRVLVVR